MGWDDGEADGTWKIKGEVDVSMHIIADIQPMAATEHLIRVSGPRSTVAPMKRERINIKYYFSHVHYFHFHFGVMVERLIGVRTFGHVDCPKSKRVGPAGFRFLISLILSSTSLSQTSGAKQSPYQQPCRPLSTTFHLFISPQSISYFQHSHLRGCYL